MKGRKDQHVEVTILREGHEVRIPVEVSADGIVGLQPRSPAEYFTFATEKSSYVPAGIRHGSSPQGQRLILQAFLGSKAGMKQMGRLIAMSKAYGPRWVWQRFWEMTAFLIGLGGAEHFADPALDGGHVMFLLYEAIARKPANARCWSTRRWPA